MRGEARRLPYPEPDCRPTMLARVLYTVSLVNPVFFFFFQTKRLKAQRGSIACP